MNDKTKTSLPIVYSCSGCSSAAQMANFLAIRLDREKLAEMSCIAGVGGKVKPLVKKAQSGRDIVVIDGCPLKCSKHCLGGVSVSINDHYVLSDYQVKKVIGEDFDKDEAETIYQKIKEALQSL